MDNRVGYTFGRPFDEPLPWWDDDAEPNADLWAPADESRGQIVGLYHRAWAHSDATIDTLELDALGEVPVPTRARCAGSRPELSPRLSGCSAWGDRIPIT
jgi:hypothetical protein